MELVFLTYPQIDERSANTAHREIGYDSQHPAPLEFKVPTVKTVIGLNQLDAIERPGKSIDTLFESNEGFQPNRDYSVGYQKIQAHPSNVGRYDRSGVSRDRLLRTKVGADVLYFYKGEGGYTVGVKRLKPKRGNEKKMYNTRTERLHRAERKENRIFGDFVHYNPKEKDGLIKAVTKRDEPKAKPARKKKSEHWWE